MKNEAIVRNLIPFLTEFGGSNDWTNLETNLEPTQVYKRKQIRAYMDLQYKQIEDYLLNSTYWNLIFIIQKTTKIIGISKISLYWVLTDLQGTLILWLVLIQYVVQQNQNCYILI
jgi:hypothetical protein